MILAYKGLLNKGFKSAFDLVSTALEAAGKEPRSGAPAGSLWSFPDGEARDLAARIFGDAKGVSGGTVPQRFNIVKSRIQLSK